MAAPELAHTPALQAPPCSSRLGSTNEIKCGWDLGRLTRVAPPFLVCRSRLRLPAPEAWAATSASVPASLVTFNLQSRENQSPA